mmetsp:Transcript_20599/g.29552  ORF Transcript_20599/g.29552 Transcript_20599/m.29552 type:complete len:560 (-) Transcript_20599:55-1734(-)
MEKDDYEMGINNENKSHEDDVSRHITPSLSVASLGTRVSALMQNIYHGNAFNEETDGDRLMDSIESDDDTPVEARLDRGESMRNINMAALNASLSIRASTLSLGSDDKDADNLEVQRPERIVRKMSSISEADGTGSESGSISIPSTSRESPKHAQAPLHTQHTLWDHDRGSGGADHHPLMYEIFAGRYSNYHIRLRDLFLHLLDITTGVDEGDITDKSVRDVLPRKKPGKSVQNEGMAVGRLRSRDLRRLDYHYTPQEEPTVLIRRHAVCISLDPLRTIVMADRVVGFVPDGADRLLETFYRHMKVWEGESATTTSSGQVDRLSFEMQAYEAIFGTVIEILKQEEGVLRDRIISISAILRKYSIVPVEIQEKFRQYKYEVSEQLERAQAHKQIIEELMEEDEEMALMNLSALKAKPQLYKSPLSPEILETHEEVEALLDSYLMDYNALLSRLKLSRSKLESSEDMVSLRLDTSRNQLLVTNTTITVVSCTFAMGGFVGSIWGMNLKSGLEESRNAFWIISGITIFVMILVTYITISYMKYAEIIPKRGLRFSKKMLKSL